MAAKKDFSQRALEIVEQTTGDGPLIDTAEKQALRAAPQKQKNAAAVQLGKLGGMKGGKARAEKLTAEQRKEIARRAAKKRWEA
ncbi:MAG: hypothetical protein JO295_13925 [Verrucomicrobia bacterium]|nr:hypothetical protein [Verrucomicrobiota bacterium]